MYSSDKHNEKCYLNVDLKDLMTCPTCVDAAHTAMKQSLIRMEHFHYQLVGNACAGIYYSPHIWLYDSEDPGQTVQMNRLVRALKPCITLVPTTVVVASWM